MDERIDVAYRYGDEEEFVAASKNEALRLRREKLLRAEAARHGANALYLLSTDIDRDGGMPNRKRIYLAVHLSSYPPKYPDVDTLLERLDLAKDGFREVNRFTAKLEDLPGRAPEPVKLERGNCYMFAIAFHPEPIDRPSDRVTSIEFKLDVPHPHAEGFPKLPEVSTGFWSFTERREDMKVFRSQEFLDGIWSRTGAGRLTCPVYRSQTGQISFKTHQGSGLKNPPAFAPGRGTADFVVYARKLSTEDFNAQSCGRCLEVARRCIPREPLAGCSELSRCLQATGITLNTCSGRF